MRFFLFLLAVTGLAALPAAAVETVKSPSVTKGELGFEYKGKYEHDHRAARDGRQEANGGISYGVTRFWQTEVEGVFDQPAGGAMEYANVEWENVLRVADQKDIGVDLALHQALSFSEPHAGAHAYMFGLIARRGIDTNFGPVDFTGNLRLSRDFGGNAENGTSFIYRGQALYNYHAQFKPGLEVYGDTRKKDAFVDQSLKVGPVIKGGFDVAEKQAIGYEVGYTFGATSATPDGTLRWKLEYNIMLD